MPTVADILARKGSDVVSITPDATVLAAAELMNARGVGGLLVVDENKNLVGVFTERDVLRRVVVAGLAPATTLVRDVQTSNPVTVLPATSLDECGAIMTKRRVRHLPVADDSTVYGVVTSGDVMAFRVVEHETTIEFLNSYMFGTR